MGETGLSEPFGIIAGVVALLVLVIKELLSFIKEYNKKKTEWDGKTERRSGANIDEINNSLQLLVLPLLTQQVKILTELEKLAKESSERALNTNFTVQFGITGLKENQEKMRNNLHTINNDQQKIINEIQKLDCGGRRGGKRD